MNKNLSPLLKTFFRTLPFIGWVLGLLIWAQTLSAQIAYQDRPENRYYYQDQPIDFQEYQKLLKDQRDTLDDSLNIMDGIYHYHLKPYSAAKHKRIKTLRDLSDQMPNDTLKTEQMLAWIGKTFPSFKMQDIKGNIHRSADFTGKVLVLNFWSTSCGPCIKEFPHLHTIAQDYRAQKAPIEFLAITFETPYSIQEFFALQQIELAYHKIGSAQKFVNHFCPYGIPVNMIVDAQGRVFSYLLGDVDPKSFKQMIADALAGKDPYTHGRAGYAQKYNPQDMGPISPETYQSIQQ